MSQNKLPNIKQPSGSIDRSFQSSFSRIMMSPRRERAAAQSTLLNSPR